MQYSMIKKVKKILVTEDEKSLAKVLQAKLTRSGYEVKVAFNGEECLQLLKNESFDLILLDLIMPRVDGFSVMRELHTQGPMPDIIVMSNLGQESDVDEARSLGAKDYLVKSNTPLSALVERVEDFFKGKK
jgi:DNA-binding response OmpR family regulator